MSVFMFSIHWMSQKIDIRFSSVLSEDEASALKSITKDNKLLIAKVSVFLTLTLPREKLSADAEEKRKQLLGRLVRETSPPQAYIDMNGSNVCSSKLQHQTSDFYEEFDSSFESNLKCKRQIADGFVNNFYNNMCLKDNNVETNNGQDAENYINIKYSDNFDDTMYINPSSPLANTPVIQTKPCLTDKNPSSNSNSERNSIISYKKDSPEKSSDSSSFTSSSTRCDESPEVLAMSASALRYAASKSGVLGRKEKFLFMDHTKSCWVAVLNQTLFVFTSDKDSKPLYELDITGYQARPVTISNNNNKNDFKFELVSPGKKTHQFIADKQSDMEKWIATLNTATKASEPIAEGPRQLPTPPLPPQETYDMPDSAVRPLITEAEYELPDVLLRSPHARAPSHQRNSSSQSAVRYSKDSSRRSSSQSMTLRSSASDSPRETRRLPQLPQEVYDLPDAVARPVAKQPDLYEGAHERLYHSIDDSPPPSQSGKDPGRRLPLLPYELETYDHPEPNIRPVSTHEPVIQEEFYSVIDNHHYDQTPDSQGETPVYRNLVNNRLTNDEDDSNYYNLVPYPENTYPEKNMEQECIYDVITEKRQLQQPEPNKKPVVTVNPSIPTNSVKTEIKQKTDEKKLSPFVSNMATIFNKPFVKPQLREVKPPFVQKGCQ